MDDAQLTEAEARALLDREKARGRKISEGHARRRRRLEEARALLEKAEREQQQAEAAKRQEVFAERDEVVRETLRKEHPQWDTYSKPERRKLFLCKLNELYPE